MPSTTGIELSSDSCVLVRARPARGGIELSALHTFGRMEWPTQDVAMAGVLRTVRRRKRFPRHARVVVWGLPEDLALDNPIVSASVTPIVAAGFRVQAVMSPAQALAALARARGRAADTAAVWLALNMPGAAIAIVRDGELLYSRTFDWAYRPDALGTKAELLQRYTLVAHLAPEVRRGISVVRASHGVAVDAVVTCGNLPELRSLTMPLIEELDLEVETLDSAEGLLPTAGARIDRFVELAPALRLACAAAAARLPRRGPSVSRPWRVAAAIVLVAAGLWAGLRYRDGRATGSAETGGIPPTEGRAQPSDAPSRPASAATGPSVPSATAPGASAPPAAAPPPLVAAPPAEAPAAAVATPTQPEPTGPVFQPTPSPSIAAAGSDVPPAGSPDTISRPAPPRSAVGATESLPSLPPPQAPSFGVPVRRVQPVRTVEKEPKPEPLKTPIPVIDSILIAHDRRLAVIGGAIVGIGDSVGPRMVIAIDGESVVFREPSGFELRVSLRTGSGR